MGNPIIQDIREIEAKLQAVEKAMLQAEAQKKQAVRDCDEKKQRAESTYKQTLAALTAEADNLTRGAKQQYTNQSISQDDIDAEYRKNAEAANGVRQRYHQQILNCDDQIAEYDRQLSHLPQKITSACQAVPSPRPVITDDRALSQLYAKIVQRSLWREVLRVDGRYAYTQMVQDFWYGATKRRAELETTIKTLSNRRDQEMDRARNMADRERKNRNDSNASLKTRLQQELQQKLQGIEGKKHAAMTAKQQAITAAEATQKQEIQRADAMLSSANRALMDLAGTDLVNGFTSRAKTVLAGTGALETDWAPSGYAKFSAHGGASSIGNMMIPIRVNTTEGKKLLERKFPNVLVNGAIKVPVLVGKKKPLKMYFQYDVTTKTAVAESIQTVLLQKMRCNLKEGVSIYFADPAERGKNLGVLVAPAEDNRDIGLECVNTKDTIHDAMEKISKKIESITGVLGSCASIEEYNKTAQKRITETVLVLFDAESCVEHGELDTLRVIWNNAARCGITVLLAGTGSPATLGVKDGHKTADWSFLLGDDTYLVTYLDKTKTIKHHTSVYEYMASSITKGKRAFVDAFRRDFASNRAINNNFAAYFNADKAYDYADASKGISLPVMVRTEPGGGLCNFVIGTSTSTHTLITGTTGSGKSTFLHMLISSLIMNYHPDDVELWLVDYGKVEFEKYFTMRTPHIRFISLEKGAEFTYSFLEYLKDFFTAREKLFVSAGVTSIQEYRQKFGPLSMPRVLIVIDEFHVMTQDVQAAGPTYKNLLENALAEYRKFGLSCIFSNQTESGLSGLSTTGKLQIKNRVAMANDLQEMKDTLSVRSDNYDEDMLRRMERTARGEFWYKEWLSESDFVMNSFKAIYINDDERNRVIKTSLSRGETARVDTEIYEIKGTERAPADMKKIRRSLEEYGNAASSTSFFRVFLGHPATIKPIFDFDVEQKYNHNIALLGNDAPLLESVVTYLARSAKKQGIKLILVAGPDDNLKATMESRNNIPAGCEVLESYGDICAKIAEMHRYVERKEPLPQKTLMIWLGLSDLYDEFSVSPSKKEYMENGCGADESQTKSKSKESFVVEDVERLYDDPELVAQAEVLGMTVAEMIGMLSGAGGGAEERSEPKPQKKETYNATEDMLELFAKGGRAGLIHAVTFGNYFEAKRIRSLSMDWFIHKIAFAMAREESYDWGLSSKATELTQGLTALYTNGIRSERFRPYLL